jgi:hypothetical protein
MDLTRDGSTLKWNGVAVQTGSDSGTYLSNVVEDTTPQLGGNLDLNDYIISSSYFYASQSAVGIGTMYPLTDLHINGIDPELLIQESSTEFVKIGVRNGDVDFGWDDSDDLHFGVYSTPTDTTLNTRMVITADGKVGIGTTSPGEELTVHGDISASGDLYLQSSTNSNIYVAGYKKLTLGLSTAEFVCNISASGNITASGNMLAQSFVGDGSNLTGVTAEWDGTHLGDAVFSGSVSLTKSGSAWIDIPASTIMSGNRLHNRSGTLYWGNVDITRTGSGIVNVFQDTSPTLGGNLDAADKNITNISHSTHEEITINGSAVFNGYISGDGATNIYNMEDVEVKKLKSDGDSDTWIDFNTTDSIKFYAGNENLLTLQESSTDKVIVGDGGDVDFQVRTDGQPYMIFANGGTDKVGIGTQWPSHELTVAGEISASSHIHADGNIYLSDDIYLQQLLGGTVNGMLTAYSPKTIYLRPSGSGQAGVTMNDGIGEAALRVDVVNKKVGIGTTSPDEALEVIGNISASGDLFITGDEVNFKNLPTSKMGLQGRLYTLSGSQIFSSSAWTDGHILDPAMSESKFVLMR